MWSATLLSVFINMCDLLNCGIWKKIIVPLFSELFVNSFGDKAQDNQDSHFSHDSEEKGTEQGNGFIFVK